jgi:hypothetical protein
MRYFIVVGLVALGIVFLRQKSQESSSDHASLPPKPEATLTPRPASEHNWAKSAIDRAQEAKKQVKRERASNDVAY